MTYNYDSNINLQRSFLLSHLAEAPTSKHTLCLSSPLFLKQITRPSQEDKSDDKNEEEKAERSDKKEEDDKKDEEEKDEKEDSK